MLLGEFGDRGWITNDGKWMILDKQKQMKCYWILEIWKFGTMTRILPLMLTQILELALTLLSPTRSSLLRPLNQLILLEVACAQLSPNSPAF
jgi:hypothetical protein